MTKNNYLILVEGETDCWTLWYHGYQALGLPGSSTAKTLKIEYLTDIETLYIWQEPDQGGSLFVAGIAKRLFKIGYLGKAEVLKLDGFKDPSEIYIQKSKEFKKTMDYLMMTAPPLTQYVPPIPKAIKRFSKSKGNLTEDQIRRAREYFICDLIGSKVGTKILCPNHKDSSPSLHLYQNRAHCFVCGFNVNSIGWLMHGGMSFREAVAELQ